jgi:hypothetical protein
MRWSSLDVKIGAALGRIQEPGILGKLIGRRETIDGPRLSTCPTRIVAPSLTRASICPSPYTTETNPGAE